MKLKDEVTENSHCNDHSLMATVSGRTETDVGKNTKNRLDVSSARPNTDSVCGEELQTH